MSSPQDPRRRFRQRAALGLLAAALLAAHAAWHWPGEQAPASLAAAVVLLLALAAAGWYRRRPPTC